MGYKPKCGSIGTCHTQGIPQGWREKKKSHSDSFHRAECFGVGLYTRLAVESHVSLCGVEV